MNFRYHANLIVSHLDDAIENFDYKSRQTHLALKTALCCVLAIFTCFWLRVPHAYWAGISAIIMMQPHAKASLAKGWMRAGGAILGCAASLLVVLLFTQRPFFYSITIFLVITLGTYLGNQLKYGYFWAYFCGHIALISMIMVMDPYNNNPIHVAFYRAFAVTIGVVCSLIVNVVIWPEAPDKTKKQEEKKQTGVIEKFRIAGNILSIDMTILKFSLKTGLGILMAFWIWQIFRIPGGGLNMSTAIITVLQQDIINSQHKGLMRFVGCLLGASLGLAVLMMSISSPLVLALIIFVVVAPLAYIWGAKFGVAYIGAQAATAFMLTVASNNCSVQDIAPAIQRLTGITLGIGCIWLLNVVFPTKN